MKKIVVSLVAALSLSFVTVALVDAGNTKGPRQGTTVCQARGSVTYFETFYSNEQARVALVGDGSTDLDIFVYDLDGRLVAQSTGVTDIELATWFPTHTQTYRIVVTNLGSTWNRYSLATN